MRRRASGTRISSRHHRQRPVQDARDPVLREALYCIRCGACSNCCANFQAVGGHAFGGETYSGGIGGAWEAGTRDLASARFSELCTGCSRCVTQCPVRIDIPWLNAVLRQRLGQRDSSAASRAMKEAFAGVPAEDAGAPLQKLFFGRYDLAGKWGSRLAWLANGLSNFSLTRRLLEGLVGLDRRRSLPAFASPTLVSAARRLRGKPATTQAARHKAVLFADIFTNYGSPSRGFAALEVLDAIGVDVVVSEALPDGRAALSQGMIATAAKQAEPRRLRNLRSISPKGATSSSSNRAYWRCSASTTAICSKERTDANCSSRFARTVSTPPNTYGSAFRRTVSTPPRFFRRRVRHAGPASSITAIASRRRSAAPRRPKRCCGRRAST